MLHEIDPNELAARMASGEAHLVDVREPGEHARERIPGAVSMPLSRFAPAEFAVGSRSTLVLHCQSGGRSRTAARRLLEAGWAEVTHLRGGLGAWRRAGLPVESDERAPIALERQVRIVAGALVVIGVAFGAFVSPWALLLPAFVGSGLVFAGVTDFCGMGMLLARLPYNQRGAGVSPRRP